MMFGHNDEQHDHNGPKPDDTLTQDDTNATALPPAGHVMSDAPVTVAPTTTSDTADDYIMTEAPAPAAPVAEEPTVAPSAPAPAGDTALATDDLLSIKQHALQELSPLVGHLDQSPEEKFRTTMMLIQAADDQKLIPQAYEAAQAITDQKIRAQALLDVVNEINYFTQQHDQQ